MTAFLEVCTLSAPAPKWAIGQWLKKLGRVKHCLGWVTNSTWRSPLKSCQCSIGSPFDPTAMTYGKHCKRTSQLHPPRSSWSPCHATRWRTILPGSTTSRPGRSSAASPTLSSLTPREKWPCSTACSTPSRRTPLVFRSPAGTFWHVELESFSNRITTGPASSLARTRPWSWPSSTPPLLVIILSWGKKRTAKTNIKKIFLPGRNFNEVLRAIDSLQLTANLKVRDEIKLCFRFAFLLHSVGCILTDPRCYLKQTWPKRS